MENRVQDLRSKRRWTQSELARRLGVSRQTVISIERGRFDPSLPLAFQIGEVFGLRIEEIFGPEDGVLEREVSMPSRDEVFEQIRGRSRIRSDVPTAEILRQEREEREARWDEA